MYFRLVAKEFLARKFFFDTLKIYCFLPLNKFLNVIQLI